MAAYDYEGLLRAFLARSRSVAEFERRFLAAFKAEPPGMEDREFRILSDLFTHVDAYWEECRPEEDSIYEISEQTLRVQATRSLEALERRRLEAEMPIQVPILRSMDPPFSKRWTPLRAHLGKLLLA